MLNKPETKKVIRVKYTPFKYSLAIKIPPKINANASMNAIGATTAPNWPIPIKEKANAMSILNAP